MDPSEDETQFRRHAEPVFKILNTLIANEGELSSQNDSPATQKPRLRLLAAKSVLKLCAAHALCERMFEPQQFNALALMTQDTLLEVRSSFVGRLKKGLVQPPYLQPRWYIPAFLLAFEPNANLKESTLTWLRSRAAFLGRESQTLASRNSGQQHPVMESLFSRLLSLLAHHPDFPQVTSDEKTTAEDFLHFSNYILFYLSAVANENNLSLIFHVAQRVKQTRDGISRSEEISTRLHTLSDLAQAVIRRFAELYAQQHKIGGSGGSGAASILQTYPGKIGLSSSLFANLSSHEEAQNIASKNFLPERVEDELDAHVRSFMKPKSQSKKRKAEGSNPDGPGDGALGRSSSKRAKKDKTRRDDAGGRKKRASVSSAGAAMKLSRRSKKRDEDDWESGGENPDEKVGSASRRRSGRLSKSGPNYDEGGSDEDEIEMEEDMAGGDEVEEEEQVESDGEEAQENDAAMSEADGDDEDKSSENASPAPPSPPAKRAMKSRKSTSPIAVRTRQTKLTDSHIKKGAASQAKPSTGRTLRTRS
jgi:sister-chromatid-cohesion protein PDS5